MFDMINDILSMLDAGEYPETFGYLSSFDEDDDDLSPYEIASNLIHLDQPDDLPDFLIDFITELYEAEIAEGNAEAMNDLGAQYYDGHRGFEQSFEKAMHYYHLAARTAAGRPRETSATVIITVATAKRIMRRRFTISLWAPLTVT